MAILHSTHQAWLHARARPGALACYATSAKPSRPPPALGYKYSPTRNESQTAQTAQSTPPAAESTTTASDVNDYVAGQEAAIRAAQEGKSEPRYKSAERRILAIIVATPIFLVTSYFLYQRQFKGVEQKKLKAKVEEGPMGQEEGRAES